MTAPIPPDADTIRRLVAEVIARLQSEPAAPPPRSAAPASGSGEPVAAAAVTLADKVVTLAVVQRVPSGTRRALVPATAVITPSAREHARDAGIEIVRGSGAPAQSASSRPFIVAHAECGGDATGRCAAIVRGVPNAQQIPASGLADVVAAIATHASRDGARAVLLCSRPAAAVILANRGPSLRAVTARDAASLLAAATETAANLLVVDPTALPAAALDRVAMEFAIRDLGKPPTELSAGTSPSCSCQGHPH